MGVLMAIEDCLQNEGVQVFIVGPDLKQTRRIITPLIRKIVEDAPEGLVRETRSDLTWHIGSSTLMIGAFNTALESLRGLEAYSIYLEEDGLADPNEYEYILYSVLGPTLMHSRGRMVHLTTPPKEEDHPLVTSIMPEAELNKALFVYTIEDNPLLTQEQIKEEIESAGGRGSEHCERELFCKIVRDTHRLLLPEFDEFYVKPVKIPSHTYFLTAVDFGGSRDNHGGLLLYYDFERNKVCFKDEFFLPVNTATPDVIAAASKLEIDNKILWLRQQPHRIVDAPDQVLIDIKRLDFACMKPDKGRDSAQEGVQAIRTAMQRGQIEIDPKCTNLIAVCKYGMWDRRREDFNRTPALGHCDLMAAMVYGFRHLDKVTNPFPQFMGKTRDTHYLELETQDRTNEQILERFFNDE